MPSSRTPFNLFAAEPNITKTIDVTSIITGNDNFVVYESAKQANTTELNSILLNMQISNQIPDADVVFPKHFIMVDVQVQDSDENWFTIGQLFSPHRRPSSGSCHRLVLQPGTVNIDEGVPTDYFDGLTVTHRVSRQDAFVGAAWRARIAVRETAYGTADALTSFDVKLFGEIYSV